MPFVKVTLDHRAMRDILTSSGVEAPLREIAEKAAARARSTAPVRTGAYRDSIGIEVDETDRTAVRVIARDKKAMAIESRTSNLKRSIGR